MALEAPPRWSPGMPTSKYAAHVDLSVSSPESPALEGQYLASSASTSDSHALRPHSSSRTHSAKMLLGPSSDMVGPSPVNSNGTETTEIEDELAEGAGEQEATQYTHRSLMLRTNIPDDVRQGGGEESVSVIHAPQDFRNWVRPASVKFCHKPLVSGDITTGTQDGTASSPVCEQAANTLTGREPLPVNTTIKPTRLDADTQTPQAQNLQEFISDSAKLRDSGAGNLELIPESLEADAGDDGFGEDESDREALMEASSDTQALKTALEECWTLCNTLASLSTIHRKRVFNASGAPDALEKAWKSCWKLCRRLYHGRDDTSASFNVRTNLDLCRDFCQSLFDVRQKGDEGSDSVLRVSFELNNHLYSAQDGRRLPEAFRERSLDFYITLCHRLMKQRNDMAAETNSLLRACWALAEMLFSLRQNLRDGKAPDRELLGSAVQACWELCDIFREGWTHVWHGRNTLRPNQTRSQTGSRSSRHSNASTSTSLAELSSVKKTPPAPKPPPVPETPVTEFEDTPVSPESSPPMPNIMVLGGPPAGSSERDAWSSSVSSVSRSSAHTSSTAKGAAEDVNIARIKLLVLKAAMRLGFSRPNPPLSEAGKVGGDDGAAAQLQAFVKSLHPRSFGNMPGHATLFQSYRSLVLSDAAFRPGSHLPVRGKRVGASEMAKSVGWMTLRSSGQYGFLRELYRLVFGFSVEEGESVHGARADGRREMSIAV